MKKIFTLVAMAIFAFGTMMAGWQPSDTEATRLDKEGAEGQVQMKTIHTDDGKIILSWLRPERVNEVFSYTLHLQLFDAAGNPQFGDEGIVVCDKATRSWTTDYSLAMADNGDILLAYNDSRNDTGDGEVTEVYLYRYNQQGEPVWDPDGILFSSWMLDQEAYMAEDVAPQICVSGENIYVAVSHVEYPNYTTHWEVIRVNDDGTVAPTMPTAIACRMLVTRPAPEGSLYCVYENANLGFDAMRLDEDLVGMWDEPITIEERVISNGRYVPTPLAQTDDEGGLFLSYRVLESFTGYQVLNYLTPEGAFLAEAPSCNGSIDGDAGTAAIGVKDDMAFVAWEYDFGNFFMNVNVLDAAGGYCWPDESALGRSLDENDMWGFTPVKVIPQEDGWVLLYGNSTSWNGAKFMVVKLDELGVEVWRKQIGEDEFKSSGFSVAYDEKYAYIFFTQEEQYDDNWNVIPGSSGMFVMCVDIAGDEPTPSSSVQDVVAGQPVSVEVFTLDGKRVNEMESGVYIVRSTDANGNITTRKVRK